MSEVNEIEAAAKKRAILIHGTSLDYEQERAATYSDFIDGAHWAIKHERERIWQELMTVERFELNVFTGLKTNIRYENNEEEIMRIGGSIDIRDVKKILNND